MIPVLSIVGKSGVGKTTFAERLLPELKKRGVRVAVVKHHSHKTPIDVPGKDSWRYADAGATAVIVSSPAEVVRFERVENEKTLAEIAADITNADLILTEGFKREAAPKIEISRAELGRELVARADELIAVVSDHPIPLALPRFDLGDAPGLAAFIVERFKLDSRL
jgi:molybdopterin-guanine dinucleotide biosynthesis protein B